MFLKPILSFIHLIYNIGIFESFNIGIVFIDNIGVSSIPIKWVLFLIDFIVIFKIDVSVNLVISLF